MSNELQYPTAEREALYASYTIAELDRALRESQLAWDRAREIAQELPGVTFAGRKGPEWRAADYHTICRIRTGKIQAAGYAHPNQVTFPQK